MHRTSNSAEPYLYQVSIDCTLAISKSDLDRFVKATNQGVAVFGFTPNILVTSENDYVHWQTLENLVSVMDTGKLAICTDENIEGIYRQFCTNFPAVEISVFSIADMDCCKQWVTT